METLSIFDLMPDEEAKKYKPIKSTDHHDEAHSYKAYRKGGD
jgi:hypothetical protein